MFLDVPSALFTVDGVPAGLVRAGEPRLRRSARVEAGAAERAHAQPRAALLSRLVRPAAI